MGEWMDSENFFVNMKKDILEIIKMTKEMDLAFLLSDQMKIKVQQCLAKEEII